MECESGERVSGECKSGERVECEIGVCGSRGCVSLGKECKWSGEKVDW